jgi:hypothetical protein
VRARACRELERLYGSRDVEVAATPPAFKFAGSTLTTLSAEARTYLRAHCPPGVLIPNYGDAVEAFSIRDLVMESEIILPPAGGLPGLRMKTGPGTSGLNAQLADDHEMYSFTENTICDNTAVQVAAINPPGDQTGVASSSEAGDGYDGDAGEVPRPRCRRGHRRMGSKRIRVGTRAASPRVALPADPPGGETRLRCC